MFTIAQKNVKCQTGKHKLNCRPSITSPNVHAVTKKQACSAEKCVSSNEIDDREHYETYIERMKRAFRTVYEVANQESMSVKEVVIAKWGSLEHYKRCLTTAGGSKRSQDQYL